MGSSGSCEGTQGVSVQLLTVPLQQVVSIVKGEPSEAVKRPHGFSTPLPQVQPLGDETCLTLVRRIAPEVKITFDSPLWCDRAYTCLRIFHMSVDHTSDDQTTPSE